MKALANGTGKGEDVDSRMPKEPPVLGGEGRMDEQGIELVQRSPPSPDRPVVALRPLHLGDRHPVPILDDDAPGRLSLQPGGEGSPSGRAKDGRKDGEDRQSSGDPHLGLTILTVCAALTP